MNLYSVRDCVAKEFSSPFLAKNDDVAARNVCRDLLRMQALSAGDFELWYVGDFNIETGILSKSSKTDLYRVPFSLSKPEVK